MDQVRIVRGDEVAFVGVAEGRDVAASTPASTSIRRVFGGSGELELFEVVSDANHPVEPHAHEDDEIIYVIEGSLVLRGETLGPGSAVLVPAWTLYSFRAGDQGVRYAVFRPRYSARRLITRTEYLEARRSARATPQE